MTTPPITSLRVHEIYLSIQGEGTRAGLPCVLVRLSGCNLNCRWCDTPQSRTDGRQMTLDAILERVAELKCKRVEVTGGEPLTQSACPTLVKRLCKLGYETLVETNGSLDVRMIHSRAILVMDYKCPSSTEHEHNNWDNIDALTDRDEVKFVLADRADYEFAKDAVTRLGLANRCSVLFSPVHGELTPAELAKWILEDRLDVRLGLQLHRIIWPNLKTGV